VIPIAIRDRDKRAFLFSGSYFGVADDETVCSERFPAW
jgi:hypothetical protein